MLYYIFLVHTCYYSQDEQEKKKISLYIQKMMITIGQYGKMNEIGIIILSLNLMQHI